MVQLTRSQWAAKNKARVASGNLTLKERVEQWKKNPPPNVQTPLAVGVSAAPCQLRGCMKYPSVHSHSFSHWPPPSASARYQWLSQKYVEPQNLTSEWVEAEEGDKCKAPRTRCKIKAGDPMLRRKETGDKFCKKHGHFAVHGLPGTPGWERLVHIHRKRMASTSGEQSTRPTRGTSTKRQRGEWSMDTSVEHSGTVYSASG